MGDPLLKGIVIIGSGSAIAQVLGIIFVPIITRIYPPEIYGTLAVFGSLLALLMVGSSLKYELTIPLPEKDQMPISSHLVFFDCMHIYHYALCDPDDWGEYLPGIFHFEFIAPYYWLFCIGFFGISVSQDY